MKNIPDKSRKEWEDLLTGKLNVPLKNFFFQMKLTQTRTLLNNGKIDLESAIDDIYNLCVKFSKAKNMDNDIEAIFGKDNTIETKTEQIITDDYGINESSKTDTEKIETTPEIKNSSLREKTNNKNEEDSIELKLEKIRKEAEKRKVEFERQREELIQKIEEEKKAREETEKRIKLEKRKQILEAEQAAKNKLKIEKEKLAQREKEAILKATEKKKKSLQNKRTKKVKKTFFQRLFKL